MASYFAGLSLREIYEKKCAELHCHKNSELCRALPDVPDEFQSLTFIDLSKNFLGPKGILPLLEIIRRCRNIRRLDLRGQQLDNDAIDALCLVLKKHPSVVQINLSDNPLTMSAGTSLLHLAKKNPVLEYMDLDRSGIGPSLLIVIQSHLERNRMRKEKLSEEERERLRCEETQNSTELGAPKFDCNNEGGDKAHARSSFWLRESSSTPTTTDNAERRPLKTHDVEVALMPFSHNVHEVLFDEDPVPAIAHLCEQQHGWFYDTQFAADDVSVQHRATVDYGITGWRRVGDIYPSAKLFPTEEEENSLVLPRHSPLSFSWIFACVDAVFNDMESLRGSLLTSSCIEHGVYSLSVHIDGAWRYVIVDDLLPVNSKDELIFTHPVQGKYFWPCILEKALAKLHGGYSALSLSSIEGPRSRMASTKLERGSKNMPSLRGYSLFSGEGIVYGNNNERTTNCARTLSDLSGGVGIVRFLSYEHFQADEWWLTMLDLYNAGAMMLALSGTAKKTLPGIEPCHVYRILQVHQVNGVRLIELSSMWASVQWKGDWSNESPLWMRQRDVDAALRGQRCVNKGFSFWMSYADFIAGFIQVHLCQVFQGFHQRIMEDEWDRNSAGGSCYEHNWHLNPHYKLKITADSRFFVNLAVPDTRFTTTDVESLAFHIFCSKQYPLQYRQDSEQIVAATKYVATDSVCFEGVLKAGEDYWVIPSSHTSGVLGKFFLRLFSQSGFVIWKDDLSHHWNSLTYSETVECSGEYRAGDDNAQVALTFSPCKNVAENQGSKTGTLLVKVRVLEQDEFALSLFLVKTTIVKDRPLRFIGALRSENIIGETQFIMDDSVCLKAEVCPGERYTLVVCVYPAGSRAKLQFNIWSLLPAPQLTPLPGWKKKTVRVSWPQGSGSCYEVTRNPQVEIYPARLHDTFVIRMQITKCSYADPAIVFFVLGNDGRQGEGIKGQIPADRVLARSNHVRHHVVQCEFFTKESMNSLLVIPCLQPAGSFGECTISVATESGEFMVRALFAD